MSVERTKIEPHNMEAGIVTAVKLTIFREGNNPTQPKEEIIEINPVPFSELGRISGALSEHIIAKAEFDELKENYDAIKEKCKRTHKDVEAILKQPSTAETAEKHRLEMEQALREQEERIKAEEQESLIKCPEKLIILGNENPAHEEKPDETAPQQPLEPKTLRQQAESIYDKVLEEVRGKNVEDKDIMAAVLKTGIHPDNISEITEEIIKLLKEKGAISTPRGKFKWLLGVGKKDKKTKEKTK